MKLSNILIFVCILLISLQSCLNNNKNVSKDDAIIITIDLNQKTTEKKIQDIASSITFLKLEESLDHPIGIIDKIHITNRNVYILDSQHAKSLFVYDRNGNINKVINNVGQGPGDFIYPGDFDIQQNSENIIILDRNQRKLIYYSKQGDFISELKLNAYINTFASIKNNSIVMDKGNSISDKSANYIRIINEKGNQLAELLPIPEFVKEITISPRIPLQKYLDTLLFMPSMSNEIYCIYENESKLKYRIDFGSGWPSKSYLERAKGKHPLKISQDLIKDKYVIFLNYMENKDVLHLNFHYDSKNYSFYYNKHSGKSILFYMNNENVSFPLATTGSSFVCAQYVEDKNPGLMFYDIAW